MVCINIKHDIVSISPSSYYKSIILLFFLKSQYENTTENTTKPHPLEERLKVGLCSGY